MGSYEWLQIRHLVPGKRSASEKLVCETSQTATLYFASDRKYNPPTERVKLRRTSYARYFDTCSSGPNTTVSKFASDLAKYFICDGKSQFYGLPYYFSWSTHLQRRIQRGFHGFHGTPLLKGCLRKYYAQTFYVHFAHTGAMHFSFNSSNNARVSTPVSRIRRAHGLLARIYCQKHVPATIETKK